MVRKGFRAGPQWVIKVAERPSPSEPGRITCFTPGVGPHIVAVPGWKRSCAQEGMGAGSRAGCQGPGASGFCCPYPEDRRHAEVLPCWCRTPGTGGSAGKLPAHSTLLCSTPGASLAPGNAVSRGVRRGPDSESCWSPRWGDKQLRGFKP